MNESLARQFFGTANVVGQRIDVGRWKGQWLSPGYHAGTEIVGVVSDVRDIALDKPPRLTVYLPQPAGADGPPTIVASIAAGTSGRGAATPKQIADLARGVDPSVSPPVVRPLAEIVGASVAVQRYQTTLLVVLGALSVLLAVVGIFGITAYAVQVRAREISVRMALGATSASLIQLILGGAMRLVLVGVALGLGLAVGASRLLEANLFGVSATQPSVLAAAGGLMIVTAVGACVAPARRALRLQPAEALRL